MKYKVHCITLVRVAAVVEADSMEQAIERMDNSTNFSELFSQEGSPISEEIEWNDGHDAWLVDPLKENGEVDYDNSKWFNEDGVTPLNRPYGMSCEEWERIRQGGSDAAAGSRE